MNNITFDCLMWKTANRISRFAKEKFGEDIWYNEAPDLFGSEIDFYIHTSSLI